MYSFALSLCRNIHDAEDIVQDVVLKALKTPNYTDEGKGKAYLLLAVRNSFINKYRVKKYRGTHVELEEAIQIPDPITVSQKTKRVIDQRITDAISQLNPDIRLAYILANVYDYQYEEIAKICEAPLGTVRSSIHRAKEQLRKKLSI